MSPESSIDGARLAAWSRRHAARQPVRWRRAIVVGLLGCAAVTATATSVDASQASGRWLAITTATLAMLMLAIPQWIFWRPDAALIARLPITGAALFGAAVRRTVFVGAVVAIALVVTALPLLRWSPDLALRHGVAALACTLIVVALLPAVATLAAWLTSSSQVAELARGVAGEVRAPTSSWLGVLPGFVAAGVVLLLLALAPWLRNHGRTLIGPGEWLLALGVVGSLLALGVARAGTAGMAVALREVSALDRVRLAHLEINRPSLIERVVIARLDHAAAVVLDKDARLMRRRYPMAWVMGVGFWIVGGVVALAQPTSANVWAVALGVASGGYLVVLGARLTASPVEESRLTLTLPVRSTAVVRAKRAWLLAYSLVFAIPSVALTSWAVPVAAAIGGAGLVVGMVMALSRVAVRG